MNEQDCEQMKQLLVQMQDEAVAKVEAVKAEAEPQPAQLHAKLEKCELVGDLVGCVTVSDQIKELSQETLGRINNVTAEPLKAIAQTREILQRRMAEWIIKKQCN